MFSRLVAALFVSGFAFTCTPSSLAGNQSNYLHVVNGIDYTLNPGLGAPTIFNPWGLPGGTGLFGFWNCFNKEMLYSPTRVVDPADPLFGQYAAKVSGIEWNVTASVGAPIFSPLVVLSSGPGDCTFLTPAGNVNYGFASGFGNGYQAVVGPTGAGAPTVRAAFTNVSFPNPNVSNTTIYTLALDIAATPGFGSAVTIPEGENLVLFVHVNPNQTAAAPDGFCWSGNEMSLCSSHSYSTNVVPGFGQTAFAFSPSVEWAMGVKTIDAVMTAYVAPTSPTPPSANWMYGIDGGSGSQTISVNLTTQLGFLTRDSDHPAGGCGRLVLANVAGYRSCFNTVIPFATGGVGGPAFSSPLPQAPRLVGQIDALTSSLLASLPAWIAFTGHDTAVAGINIPWMPTPTAGPSGATVVTGGALLPLGALPQIIGIDLLFWSVPLDGPLATATGLDPNVQNGHSNTMGFPLTFYP